MPSTIGKMQQWQPRMPSSIASAERRWKSDPTSSNRPPQYGQRSTSSVLTSTTDLHCDAPAPRKCRVLLTGDRLAQLLEHRFGGRFERRAHEVLDAEQRACVVL